MKTLYGTILVLMTAAAISLTAAQPSVAADDPNEPLLLKGEPNQPQGPAGTPEERFEHHRKFRDRMEHRMEQKFQHEGNMPLMPPGMPESRMPGPEMRKKWMAERQAEYLEWLKKNYPDEAEKLAQAKKDNSELYLKKLMLSMRKYGRIEEASIENPKLAEVLKEDLVLREKQNELVSKIKAATNENEKKELTKKLEDITSQRFDSIIKKKQIEYEQMRERLEHLQKRVQESQTEIEKWKASKAEKVKERMQELTSGTEKFQWD
jgi:hypothetical protein